MDDKHYLISGQVQGVGYRRFTQAAAEPLELRGAVRNLSDGRVEALARGSSKSLELFEAALRRGPTGSSVRQITVSTPGAQTAAKLLEDFANESVLKFCLLVDGDQPWL